MPSMHRLLLLSLSLALTTWSQGQKFTVLYNFAGPPDGDEPMASLLEVRGAFYGTTYIGGTGTCTIDYLVVGCGTVFKVTGRRERVLYSFQGKPDGAFPSGGLVRDNSGKLYGATSAGGAYGFGTIFSLKGKKETTMFSFKGAPDGEGPTGGLLRDASGNFYGTTVLGGMMTYGYGGTVFKLDKNGNETVLYSFCSEVECTDGEYPNGGLVMDSSGNLYGTTYGGGSSRYGGGGTVFRLDTSGNETVLYSFCQKPQCADGANPESGLVMDANGTLYGTTYDGSGYGTVYKLDANGNLTVLYTFCSEPGCADGKGPIAGLIMDAQGNLYGTTLAGGDSGTVFELDTTGAFRLLYTFGLYPAPAEPVGGLVMDAKGNLYGTTSQGTAGNCVSGNSNGCGTVFKLRH